MHTCRSFTPPQNFGGKLHFGEQGDKREQGETDRGGSKGDNNVISDSLSRLPNLPKPTTSKNKKIDQLFATNGLFLLPIQSSLAHSMLTPDCSKNSKTTQTMSNA
jgi:hypothetical protein